MSKRILLVSCFFYPQNRIPVLRLGQWVKYWALQGHQITVLTTKKYTFVGPFGLEADLPPTVHVIEVPYLPKWLDMRLSAKQALGNQCRGQNKNVKVPQFFSAIKGKIRSARGLIGSLLDVHDFWVRPASKLGITLLKNDNYDLIISSFSPPAAHIVAHNIKKRFPSIPWVADFRDLWANNHINSAKWVFKILENKKEKKTIEGFANAIITVSSPLAEDLKNRYASIPTWTIENGFDPDEFPNWQDNISKQPFISQSIRICYTGTIYRKKRDPTPLFSALNDLIDSGFLNKKNIVIDFYGNNEAELKEIISQTNANRHGIIKIHGFVSRESSLRAQQTCDMLLLLEWGDPSAAGVLTGKIFEYLVSGKPIIAVGINNQNSAGKLIEETGTGFCAMDAQTIKSEIVKLIESRKFSFFNPNANLISTYSRDKQAEKIISAVFNRENL